MRKLNFNEDDYLRILKLKSIIEERNKETLKSIEERRDYLNNLKSSILTSYENLRTRRN
jgi:hypothetical protein